MYERALAQMAGSTVMRFADADLLPFDPSGSADTVKRYVTELKKSSNSNRTKCGNGIARSTRASSRRPPIPISNLFLRQSRRTRRI